MVVRDTMFILGGIVDEELTSSVELWNSEKEEWQASTDMPEVQNNLKICWSNVQWRSYVM